MAHGTQQLPRASCASEMAPPGQSLVVQREELRQESRKAEGRSRGCSFLWWVTLWGELLREPSHGTGAGRLPLGQHHRVRGYRQEAALPASLVPTSLRPGQDQAIIQPLPLPLGGVFRRTRGHNRASSLGLCSSPGKAQGEGDRVARQPCHLPRREGGLRQALGMLLQILPRAPGPGGWLL